MSQAAHTPTRENADAYPTHPRPWVLDLDENAILDADGDAVVHFDADEPDEVEHHKFLVRCVNSHSALVEALREAEAGISEIKTAFGAPGDHGYETREGRALFELYKKRLAINAALAEGKQTP